MRNMYTRLTEKECYQNGCFEITENVTNKIGIRNIGAATLKK
jgi:hypothetical protein